MAPHRRTVPAMARETKARKTTATGRKTEDHCRHCGLAAKLDSNGNVKEHKQPSMLSDCPGTGYPPLEI